VKKITVNASKKYEVLIGSDSLSGAGELIKKIAGDGADNFTAAVVTDENVAALHLESLTNGFKKYGLRFETFVFPGGEAYKTPETLFSLVNFLAEKNINRSDMIVAFGGGVVGDLAGFAAACYMRGVKIIQIPTTLISAVDSSVGGKTGVNLPAGKNLIGAFYQPDLVICDTSLLATLPKEIFTDGCAEIIKYGIIADRALFDSLNENMSPRSLNIEKIIARCVEIKRDFIAEDEFDNGRRMILNFGHTIGHAAEKLSQNKISHGRAVAAGIAVETRAAYKMGICEKKSRDEIIGMIKKYGLPTSFDFGAEELARACFSDKKRAGDHFTMIFPVKIGECTLRKIPAGEIENVIKTGLG